MTSLASVIRTHHSEIVDRWTTEAQQVAAARGLNRPEFQNIIPAYLLALADAGDALGRFTGRRREHVESHLSSRLRQGFQLAEIVEEFALLGRCIVAVWNSDGGADPPHHTQIEKLFEELHLASAAVTEMFTRHMMEDEQTEKQYLRLIQAVAREALEQDAPALRARLNDVLKLVMEAMGAQSTALLLSNLVTGKLELVASVGAAGEQLEEYVTSLHPSSFAGVTAGPDEPTAELDAVTIELKVSDRLRRSGIHSLLGVRLPPRHRLLGVMFVGLAETRPFTAREIRRLESLGSQLTLHLDNAKLYADLREHIDMLQSERELRERFVSVLAHDLRGPLSAAKMSSQILMQHPERLDERRELAMKIARNIDRTDRMIRDLLDANRIRAGHGLPLRIDACELGAVAREVYEELVATFGERFVLDTERVLGFWSAEELRRALWNLATNAIKYGAENKPITITAKRTAEGAQISVHNWGSPITPKDKEQLFLPFSRTHAARNGAQKGWGLGLTLVHGCAVAHGGRVNVESSLASGTTFTLELPSDARPFQPRPDEPQVEANLPPPSTTH